jgi:hypothetical protein
VESAGDTGPESEGSEEDYEAPASPKWDERSFFFSAAAARSSARIRTVSRRRGSLAANAAAGTPATQARFVHGGVHKHHPQQQQQQQGAIQDSTPAQEPAGAEAAGSGGGPATSGNASGGSAKTPLKATVPPLLRLPGHTEHITPPTAAMGQTPASKPGPASAAAAAAAGAKAPSQLGFKQARGSLGSRRVGGGVPELRLLAVEVHADSRGSLLPDPRCVLCIYSLCVDHRNCIGVLNNRVLESDDALVQAEIIHGRHKGRCVDTGSQLTDILERVSVAVSRCVCGWVGVSVGGVSGWVCTFR